MPLIEAINILSKFFIDDHEWAIRTGDNCCASGEETGERVMEAIEILIEYAEKESIPKEKIRKMLRLCRERRTELADGHFWENSWNVNEDTAIVIFQSALEKLLEE